VHFVDYAAKFAVHRVHVNILKEKQNESDNYDKSELMTRPLSLAGKGAWNRKNPSPVGIVSAPC